MDNPVITPNEIFWCYNNSNPNVSTSARVDEAEPYIIDSQYLIYTKCVCKNDTALQGIWTANTKEFKPEYNFLKNKSPLMNSLNTQTHKGFENLKIFMGVDGYLHLTGHNHGNQNSPHYISINNNTGFEWELIEYIYPFGEGNVYEPTPIFENGVPGDQGGIANYMIQFTNNGDSSKPFHINLMKIDWVY